MGFSHIHVVHKPHKRTPSQELPVVDLAKRDSSATSACTTGFYIAPQMGSTVDSLQPLPITWNSTCLSVPLLDIYLYSPGSTYPRIHVWEGVALSRGTYDAAIMPRWWNATAAQSLQISIVPAGEPPFMSTFPGGPVFTATYTKPASGTPASADLSIVDSGITQVDDGAKKDGGMTPGKKAAAVLLPMIFIALCIAAYLKMKRSRNVEKRKKWTEKVDKRMSTISTDWKSVSAAGANAAIRNSMAVGVGNRNSSFSFGALRPSSTLAVEGEDASGANPQRPMSQLRTGVGLRNPAALTSTRTSTTERVSRVSFAPDTRVSRVSFADSRPSGESRRTRAFHSAYIPPVPALPDHAPEDNDEQDRQVNEKDVHSDGDSEGHGTSGSFSPRQTQGALTLTPEDIRSRIAAGRARAAQQQQQNQQQEYSEKEKDGGYADVMPALSLMRTGGTDASTNGDDYLFPSNTHTPEPVSPPPSYTKPSSQPLPIMHQQQHQNSPVMHTMPMQPMPANVMSPDEMLRAYAERKKMAASMGMGGKPSISYPMPVASTTTPMPSSINNGNNNNMRVLYNAATGSVSPTHTGNGSFGASNSSTLNEGYDSAYASSEYDVYGGMNAAVHYDAQQQAQYPFGTHHANGSIGVGQYGGAQYAIGDDQEVDEHEYRAA